MSPRKSRRQLICHPERCGDNTNLSLICRLFVSYLSHTDLCCLPPTPGDTERHQICRLASRARPGDKFQSSDRHRALRKSFPGAHPHIPKPSASEHGIGSSFAFNFMRSRPESTIAESGSWDDGRLTDGASGSTVEGKRQMQRNADSTVRDSAVLDAGSQ